MIEREKDVDGTVVLLLKNAFIQLEQGKVEKIGQECPEKFKFFLAKRRNKVVLVICLAPSLTWLYT